MGSSSLPSDDLKKILSQDVDQVETSAIPVPDADADADADAAAHDTEPVVAFEPFEPGNIWTQKAPTQVQRKQWRKRVYMYQEEEEDEEEGVVILSSTTTKHFDQTSTEVDVEIDEDAANNENQPWWSKGKTAPLLSDFDSDRRSFYLAQAGIGSGGSSSNATIQEQSNHSHLGRETMERPTMNLLNQQNSFTIVTPGKKTWNTVWGENGHRSVTNSEKKSKSNNSPSKTNGTPSQTSKSTTCGSARGARGGRGKLSTRGSRKTM